MAYLTNAVKHALAAALMGGACVALAGVTAEEAAKLKGELMPLGGERAGNKEGTIPAWEGGYKGPATSGARMDPFKDDRPMFAITAKNMAEHESKLSDGLKTMLKKYPDSFRMDVYKTRRTASAPTWVYDNTFKNATRAKIEDEKLTGAFGGVPFPLPKSGEEVMWNHQVRWRGTSVLLAPAHYQVNADGRAVKVTDILLSEHFPYYFQESSPEQFYKSGYYYLARILTTAPVFRAGDGFVGGINTNAEKDQAWVYLTGQRRVRKLPNACCDTPNPNTGGITTFDEVQTFTGKLDRFDWKLLGKREIYVPYNNNRFNLAKTDTDLLAAHHVNPDYMRWELHRMWVVEATVRAGQRHQATRSRYYCDEDSWLCLLGDRWDSHGQLWKMTWGAPIVAPDLPGILMTAFGFNDLLSGSAFVSGLTSTETKQPVYEVKKRWPDTYFTPDALAGEGIR